MGGRLERRCRSAAEPATRSSRHGSTSSTTPKRRVLERGAVEGEVFHLGVGAPLLTPEEPNVTGHLALWSAVRWCALTVRSSQARTASASGIS